MSKIIGIRELRGHLREALKRGDAPGLARLIARGAVSKPAAPLDLSPVRLDGAAYPASRSLDYTRGDRAA